MVLRRKAGARQGFRQHAPVQIRRQLQQFRNRHHYARRQRHHRLDETVTRCGPALPGLLRPEHAVEGEFEEIIVAGSRPGESGDSRPTNSESAMIPFWGGFIISIGRARRASRLRAGRGSRPTPSAGNARPLPASRPVIWPNEQTSTASSNAGKQFSSALHDRGQFIERAFPLCRRSSS